MTGFPNKRPYVRSIGYVDDTNSMSFSKPIFQGAYFLQAQQIYFT